MTGEQTGELNCTEGDFAPAEEDDDEEFGGFTQVGSLAEEGDLSDPIPNLRLEDWPGDVEIAGIAGPFPEGPLPEEGFGDPKENIDICFLGTCGELDSGDGSEDSELVDFWIVDIAKETSRWSDQGEWKKGFDFEVLSCKKLFLVLDVILGSSYIMTLILLKLWQFALFRGSFSVLWTLA